MLDCCLCGKKGQSLYVGLIDRLYAAPGEWNLSVCPDTRCGLIWLNPMPVEADIAMAYKSYFTHHRAATLRNRLVQFVKAGYLARKYGYRSETVGAVQKACGLIAYLALFRRTGLDYLVNFLSTLPRGRLLDLGCGDGKLVEFMQDRGWQAEGIDFDPAAVENATRRGLRVEVGTLQAKHYPDNSFDAIILSHFIEHVHEPVRLLIECHRVLKPGGRVLILTPNAHSWGHRRFKGSWRGLEPPRHLHLFSPQSIHQLLTRAGFQKITVTTTLRNAGKILRLSATAGVIRTGAMQLMEWMEWKRNPEIGEEIDLVAEK
jgi:SAM-dependent methyltransferase